MTVQLMRVLKRRLTRASAGPTRGTVDRPIESTAWTPRMLFATRGWASY